MEAWNGCDRWQLQTCDGNLSNVGVIWFVFAGTVGSFSTGLHPLGTELKHSFVACLRPFIDALSFTVTVVFFSWAKKGESGGTILKQKQNHFIVFDKIWRWCKTLLEGMVDFFSTVDSKKRDMIPVDSQGCTGLEKHRNKPTPKTKDVLKSIHPSAHRRASGTHEPPSTLAFSSEPAERARLLC